MITFSEFLHEARKNPEMNPKISINDRITDFFTKAKNIPKTRMKNAFVSFTALEKLGINPKSEYDTPLGIYAYPMNYVKKNMGKEKSATALPFAGDQPFVNLFSVKGEVIDLKNLNDAQVKDYYTRIKDVFLNELGNKKEDWKKNVDRLERLFITGSRTSKLSSLPSKFWNVTLLVAQEINKIKGKSKSQFPITWNYLFRSMGIAGVVDPGFGIIHSNEPTQAVFFERSSIIDVERHDNKYSPENVKNRISSGEQQKSFVEGMKSLLADLKKKNATEAEYIKEIKKNGYLIRLIKDPTEEMQLAALSYAKPFIKWIKNPTERAQLKAIQNTWKNIQYINNPSVNVQMNVIKQNIKAFSALKKPAQEVVDFYNKNKSAFQ